jgi:predicted membrane protein
MKFVNIMIVIYTVHFNDSDIVIAALTALYFYSETLWEYKKKDASLPAVAGTAASYRLRQIILFCMQVGCWEEIQT